jgi:multidrug efflux pump subunit AcrA (membrane-fusion protein)
LAGSSWSLEPSQRTLRTEIDFDNADGRLRPGMYAHALVDVIQPESAVIPSQAVQTRDGLTFCFYLEGDKVTRVPLRLGARAGDNIEIRKKQVRATKPGEKPRWLDMTGTEEVVTTASGDLEDGLKVRVDREH